LASAAALALLAASPCLAAEDGVSLQNGWMRFVMSTVPAGGYFTLTNATDTRKMLTGATSPDCGDLMLHESRHEGGQEQMVTIKQVAVPAHGTVSFAPGGYHLMCMRPNATVKPGGSVPVTLLFADGGRLEADFAVKGAAGK
jgi:hypothetical protein